MRSELQSDVAALLAAHAERDYALGPFANYRTSNADKDLAAGRLLIERDSRGDPLALVVWREQRARSTLYDFRGLPAALVPALSSVVEHMAGTPGHRLLLAQMIERLPRPLFVHVWQEHPTERRVVADLGLRHVATKVDAFAGMRGVYASMGPRVSYGFDKPSLVQLDVPCDVESIADELAACTASWVDHYSNYNRGKSWSALSLRSFGGSPFSIVKPCEMTPRWQREHPDQLTLRCADTPLLDSFPSVQSLLDELPGYKERVRLMRLAPGHGELSRHCDITDPDAGSHAGKRLRLHFPIVTNPRVIFEGWTSDGDVQRTHMAAGSCWSLDTRKPHTARNDGDDERVHLVIDVDATPELLARALGPARVVRVAA